MVHGVRGSSDPSLGLALCLVRTQSSETLCCALSSAEGCLSIVVHAQLEFPLAALAAAGLHTVQSTGYSCCSMWHVGLGRSSTLHTHNACPGPGTAPLGLSFLCWAPSRVWWLQLALAKPGCRCSCHSQCERPRSCVPGLRFVTPVYEAMVQAKLWAAVLNAFTRDSLQDEWLPLWWQAVQPRGEVSSTAHQLVPHSGLSG